MTKEDLYSDNACLSISEYDSTYSDDSSGYETFGEDYEPHEEDFESDDSQITATKSFPW